MNIKINPNVNTLQSNTKNSANKNIAFGSTTFTLCNVATKFAHEIDFLEREFPFIAEKRLFEELTEAFTAGKWHYSENQILSGSQTPLSKNNIRFENGEGDEFLYMPSHSRRYNLPPTKTEFCLCTGGDVYNAKELIYSRDDGKTISSSIWSALDTAIRQFMPK